MNTIKKATFQFSGKEFKFDCKITEKETNLMSDFMNFAKFFEDKESLKKYIDEWFYECCNLEPPSRAIWSEEIDLGYTDWRPNERADLAHAILTIRHSHKRKEMVEVILKEIEKFNA